MGAMSSESTFEVAIVGGGFSGTMLAAQLARRGIGSALIDGSGRHGRGTAYSTDDAAHLLNIPAERMSAWPQEPDDFLKRVEAAGGGYGDFAQRRFYGQYLDAILAEAVRSGRVTLLNSTAISVAREGEGWRVRLDNGSDVVAKALALAAGNQAPQRLAAFDGAGDRYIPEPWGLPARSAIRQTALDGGTVLVIGTGLSMVDLALSLDAAGPNGRIIAVSRRGLVPRSNADQSGPRPSADLATVPLRNLRALVQWLRREAANQGWRHAVDSLRPHSHAVWQSLPLDQQRRFLRHARPWWDVHRHRIAPQVARTIAAMIAAGRLEILAGRVNSVEKAMAGLRVGIHRRVPGSTRDLAVSFAINSTGPLHAMSSTQDPLLRGLIDSGEARPEPLDIGLVIDEASRVAGSRRLWALGALAKGRYWEIIAVPDIREQAAQVAEDIAKELGA
jgi:uncharacterized NAD(P)/FAD-binding protein YdhS